MADLVIHGIEQIDWTAFKNFGTKAILVQNPVANKAFLEACSEEGFVWEDLTDPADHVDEYEKFGIYTCYTASRVIMKDPETEELSAVYRLSHLSMQYCQDQLLRDIALLKVVRDVCEDCDHCSLHGYDPNKKIMTISFMCDLKGEHTGPDRTCDKWVMGDPFEKAKTF